MYKEGVLHTGFAYDMGRMAQKPKMPLTSDVGIFGR